MMDIDGLRTKGCSVGNLDGHKVRYTKDYKSVETLIEVFREIKPTVVIGAWAVARAFTTEVLLKMANNNKRPLIFALRNPTSKAEYTAQRAYDYTEFRCIFSSGSPFWRGQVQRQDLQTWSGQQRLHISGNSTRCNNQPVFITLPKNCSSDPLRQLPITSPNKISQQRVSIRP